MIKDTSNRREPVKVRTREMKTGGASVYLDINHNGTRRQVRLNIFLRPEKTKEDKQWNKDQLKLADAVKSQYIIELQNGTFGIKDMERQGRTNLVNYCREISEDYKSNGQTSCVNLMENMIRRLIAYRGENITLNQVDKEYLLGFIDFLDHETNTFDQKSKDFKKSRNLYLMYIRRLSTTA